MDVCYVCICMHKLARLGGSGGMLPQDIFRCSEISSEAILGQKQSCSSYMARRVLHPIFSCLYMHLLSQLTSNLHERRYYDLQNSRWGDRWWNSMQRILKICQKTIKLIWLQISQYTVHFHAFSESWYDSRLFSFCFTVGNDLLEGQQVNSWAPQIAIYLRMYSCTSIHRGGIKLLTCAINKWGACVQPNLFGQR